MTKFDLDMGLAQRDIVLHAGTSTQICQEVPHTNSYVFSDCAFDYVKHIKRVETLKTYAESK